MSEPVKTVDLTPTREGYFGIGAMFAAQLYADIKPDRRADDVQILRSLLDIAYITGVNDAQDDRESGNFTSERDSVLDALLSRLPRGRVNVSVEEE